MIELSVIIVSYNSDKYIYNCINSIMRHNDISDKLEIIVVEQSESSGLYKSLISEYKSIRVFKNTNNGFGAGNNYGAKKSKGKYLLFLNPDTILVEPIFSDAINYFKKNLKKGTFGMKLISNNFEANHSYFFTSYKGIIAYILFKILAKFDLFIPNIMFTSGADIFIRKDLFQKIGMFDEKIFLYMEERDLLRRVNKEGYQNGYFNKHKIVHIEGKRSDNRPLNSLKYRFNSLKYYCDKYGLNFRRTVTQEIREAKFKLFFLRFYKNKNRSKIIFIRKKILFLKSLL